MTEETTAKRMTAAGADRDPHSILYLNQMDSRLVRLAQRGDNDGGEALQVLACDAAAMASDLRALAAAASELADWLADDGGEPNLASGDPKLDVLHTTLRMANTALARKRWWCNVQNARRAAQGDRTSRASKTHLLSWSPDRTACGQPAESVKTATANATCKVCCASDKARSREAMHRLARLGGLT